jgi:hypothetical protein
MTFTMLWCGPFGRFVARYVVACRGRGDNNTIEILLKQTCRQRARARGIMEPYICQNTRCNERHDLFRILYSLHTGCRM